MSTPDTTPSPDATTLIDKFGGRFAAHAMRRRRRADGTYGYDYVSSTVAETFGLDPAALTAGGAVSHDWLHPDDHARFMAALETSAMTLRTLDEEVRVILPDNSVRWVRSLGEPKREANGDVVWDGMALDVTERREALEMVSRAMEIARAAEVAANLATAAPAAGNDQRLAAAARIAAQDLRAALPKDGPADMAAAQAALERLEAAASGAAAGERADAAAPGLTVRQTEIARLAAGGMANREIAERLGLTVGTVKLHISRILSRLGARNRTEMSRKLLHLP